MSTLSIRWVSRPGWATAHAELSWEMYTAAPGWSPCGCVFVSPRRPTFRECHRAKPSSKPKCKACLRALRGHLKRYERNHRIGVNVDHVGLLTTAKITRLRRELGRIDAEEADRFERAERLRP